jgi:hypothetical protein
VTWLIGAYAILFGIVEITLGFRLRGFSESLNAPVMRQA